MAQITIKYDARNSMAKKAIEVFLSLPFFEITKVENEESPYDPEFVKEIQAARKSKGKKIKSGDLWN
ncbi:MAG: hypothetical protein LBH82_00490 [Bacteroidales bacterium]|jgi:hypothetical protein|nr:hypothetical protein [Bacteroidales bacterium]